LNKILQLLQLVVPYHQAAILISDGTEMSFVAHNGYLLAPNRAAGVLQSAVYALIVTHRQAIYIPNAHKVPGWAGLESLGKPHAWLGVPLLTNDQSLGLLSINRNVERAFNPEERETALAFAQRITDLFSRDQHDNNL
jgi:GAF domain-containing protein